MTVHIVETMAVSRPGSGHLDPVSPGSVSPPIPLSPESAGSVAVPVVLTPEASGDISTPNTLTPNALPSGPPFPTSHARICYDNLLTQAGASATATDDNAGATKVLIPNTFERWRPGSGVESITIELGQNEDVDYIAIGAHNLGTKGVDVEILTSDTTGGGFTSRLSVSPTDDRPILLLLDPEIDVRRIKVEITNGTDREIGVISAGIALQMERPLYGGHSPVNLSSRTDYQNSVSDTGQWLGRTITRDGLQTNYQWNNLSDDWYREYFEPFVQAAKSLPFFIAWRPDLYPDEVAYCWTTSDIKPTNRGGGTKLMNVGISVRGHGDV